MEKDYKNPVQIGSKTVPASLSTTILARIMSIEALLELWDKYQGARKRVRKTPPTDEQRAMADAVRGGLSVSEAAHRFAVSQSVIYGSIRRVATHEYMSAKV